MGVDVAENGYKAYSIAKQFGLRGNIYNSPNVEYANRAIDDIPRATATGAVTPAYPEGLVIGGTAVSKFPWNKGNWWRVGKGTKFGKPVTRIAWGAGNPKYLNQIKNPYLKKLNIKLREFNGGHLDLW